MALQKISFQTSPPDAGKRLDQVVAARLTISKGKARKLIIAGAVYLNGRRVRIASKELIPGARIDAFVDAAKLASDGPSRDRAFDMSGADILFEDEWLIAVNKPAGLPTQPTLDEARENLFAAAKRFLAVRDGVVQPYLGLHHRLDRDTSGVVLLTKKPEANAGVSELFSGRLAEKTYNAITLPPESGSLPSESWQIRNFLAKDRSATGKRARFTSVHSGGDLAETDFRLIEAMRDGLWIEAKPRTGRTHQIRVHLLEFGLPILGDPVYRARGSEKRAPRCLLHALGLTFPHPIHKNLVSVKSPLPEDFIQCLRARSKTPGADS